MLEKGRRDRGRGGLLAYLAICSHGVVSLKWMQNEWSSMSIKGCWSVGFTLTPSVITLQASKPQANQTILYPLSAPFTCISLLVEPWKTVEQGQGGDYLHLFQDTHYFDIFKYCWPSSYRYPHTKIVQFWYSKVPPNLRKYIKGVFLFVLFFLLHDKGGNWKGQCGKMSKFPECSVRT